MRSEAVVKRALELYEDRLSELPNVVGLGIVDDPNGTGPAVAVYVSEKVPPKVLSPPDRIPQFLMIEQKNLECRVPVRVIETGIPKLESAGKLGRD
jgi:hypothetical protein